MLAKLCISRARTTCGHSTLIVLVLKDTSLTFTLSMLAVSLWTVNKSSPGGHIKTSSLKFFCWVITKTCAESALCIFFVAIRRFDSSAGFFAPSPQASPNPGSECFYIKYIHLLAEVKGSGSSATGLEAACCNVLQNPKVRSTITKALTADLQLGEIQSHH